MSFKMNEWQKKLTLEFSDNPETIGRNTARRYGVAWGSAWDMKQRLIKGEVVYEDALTKPKILLFDIETAPVLAHIWSIWGQNVSLNQIMEDWYMLSWSAKWLGEEEIYRDSLYEHLDFSEDDHDYDYPIIVSLWKMLDEADIIIGHNVRKFDDKKFKARCLKYGLKEPSSYRIVDTLDIAKQNFNLTSNKLDFLATFLGLPNKVSHEGHTLWVKCMNGDPEAWATMIEYNDYDVVLLEEVYLKIRHWDKRHPNVAIYYNDKILRCNTCGSSDLEETGNTVKTNLSEFTEYRCNCCSKVSRGGANLLDKTKRSNLARNITR